MKHALVGALLVIGAWLGVVRAARADEMPPLRVLAVAPPSASRAVADNPLTHLAVMESLVPLRFQLVVFGSEEIHRHAQDGQSLYSGMPHTAPADKLFADAVFDAVTNRSAYDVLWLLGDPAGLEERTRDAIAKAHQSGTPMVLWNCDGKSLESFGVAGGKATPDDPLVPALANAGFEQTRAGRGGYESGPVPEGVSIRRCGLKPEDGPSIRAVGKEGEHALEIEWPSGPEGIWVDLGNLVVPDGTDLRAVAAQLHGRIAGKGTLRFYLRHGPDLTPIGSFPIGSFEAPEGETWQEFRLPFQFPDLREPVNSWGILILLNNNRIHRETVRLDDLRFTEGAVLSRRAAEVATVRAAHGGKVPPWTETLPPAFAGVQVPDYPWKPLESVAVAGAGQDWVVNKQSGDIALAAMEPEGRGRLLIGATKPGPLLLPDQEKESAQFWLNACQLLAGRTLSVAQKAPSSASVQPLKVWTEPAIVKPGKTVRLQAGKTAPGATELPEGELTFAIRDFSGRLLARLPATRSVAGWEATWTVPDVGPRGTIFRCEALSRNNGATVARGEGVVRCGRTFDPREHIWYGTWLQNSSDSPLFMAAMKRFFDGAGVDSLTNRSTSLLETYGFAGQFMAGNGPFDMQFPWSNKDFAEMAANYGPGFDYAKSPVHNLVCWGEEPHFNFTFTWDDAKPVPPDVLRWFHTFLRERYHNDIGKLAKAWGEPFKSFDEVPLKRAYFADPGKWSLDLSTAAGDGVARHLEQKADVSVASAGDTLPAIGKYRDTRRFFSWYNDGVVHASMNKALAEAPWCQHFSSQPGADMDPVTPVAGGYNHPFYAKERAYYPTLRSRREGWDNPPGRLQWHFVDDPMLQANGLAQDLAVGTGYLISWYDMPLQYNWDLTASQGGARMDRTLADLRLKAEGPYLHNRAEMDSPVLVVPRFENTGEGLFGIKFPEFDAVISTVLQSGFTPRLGRAKDIVFPAARILFFQQVCVSDETAARVKAFAEAGGTVVLQAGAAAWDEFGNPQLGGMHPALRELAGIAPGTALRTEAPIEWRADASVKPDSSLATGSLLGFATPLKSVSLPAEVKAADVKLCGTYPDGTPALTVRPADKGQALFMNLACSEGQWNHGSYPERYTATRLVQSLCTLAGLTAPLPRIVNGSSDVGPHQSLWERRWNATGDLAYVLAYNDPRGPDLAARLLTSPGAKARDLITGTDLESLGKGDVNLPFAPGQFRLLAVRSADPKKLVLTGRQDTPQTLRLSVTLDSGKGPWPGQRSVRLRFINPKGQELEKLRRWLPVTGTGSIDHQIALDDAPGRWTVEAWEPVAALWATHSFTIEKADTVARSERSWELAGSTGAEVVERLRGLTQLYQTAGDRPRLSYYLHCRADGRHAVVRPLERLDWRSAEPLLATALRGGETIMLTGEDLGRLPGDDRSTAYLYDSHAFDVVGTLIAAATAIEVPVGLPDTLIFTIGKGRLILDRLSWDETFPPRNTGAPDYYPRRPPSRVGEYAAMWRAGVAPNGERIRLKTAAGRFDLDAWWRHGLESPDPESFVAAVWPQLSRMALEPAREGEAGARLDVLETLVTDHERRLTQALGTLDAAAVGRLLGTYKNLYLPPAVLGRVPLTQAVIRDGAPARNRTLLAAVAGKATIEEAVPPQGSPHLVRLALPQGSLILDREGGWRHGQPAQGVARVSLSADAWQGTAQPVTLAEWLEKGSPKPQRYLHPLTAGDITAAAQEGQWLRKVGDKPETAEGWDDQTRRDVFDPAVPGYGIRSQAGGSFTLELTRPMTLGLLRLGGEWKGNLPEVVELKVHSSLDGTEWKDVAAVKDARSWYADGDGVMIPETEPARFWRLSFRHGDYGKGGCIAFQKLMLFASER